MASVNLMSSFPCWKRKVNMLLTSITICAKASATTTMQPKSRLWNYFCHICRNWVNNFPNLPKINIFEELVGNSKNYLHMKKILYLSVFSFLMIGSVSAQEKTKPDDKQNVFEKGDDAAKMILAEQKFYAGDFKGALAIYQDLLAGTPNNANVIFHIAECYFEMKQYKEARENAEKAKGIDPKANPYNSLLLGKIYQIDRK